VKGVKEVQNRVIPSILALAAVLVCSLVAFGQAEIGEGWGPCPRCLTRQQQADLAQLINEKKPFNPHDFSGVWNTIPSDGRLVLEVAHDAFAADYAETGVIPKNLPSLTEYGKKLFDATHTEFNSPNAAAVTDLKDPVLRCDPLGWPRWFSYNYGIEFVTLPDRVIQFIEWGHTFRTIWTDGRKLPNDPPIARFLGYAVGHWEGDTLIVESNGYDDRSWISEAGSFITKPGSKGRGLNGWPHSDEMRIVERWRRTSYAILEAELTIIDPKVYAKPWVTEAVKHLLIPNAEIWEYFCVPSDSQAFNERVIKPSNGAK
jgi:hypothetical protein